jgi:hypothetical protein
VERAIELILKLRCKVRFDGMDAENTEVRFSSHHDRVK